MRREYFRKDGSRVPVLLGAAAFDEECKRGVAFVVDLTERKQAEEALRRSRSFPWAEGQKLSHAGSWSFKPDALATTGRASYTEFSDSTPERDSHHFLTISQEYIQRTAKLWRQRSPNA